MKYQRKTEPELTVIEPHIYKDYGGFKYTGYQSSYSRPAYAESGKAELSEYQHIV